jgi:hypothetical protein
MKYASDGGLGALEQSIDTGRILSGITSDRDPKLIESALMRLSGESVKSIANRFGVCTQTASKWISCGLRQRGLGSYDYKWQLAGLHHFGRACDWYRYLFAQLKQCPRPLSDTAPSPDARS